MNRVRSVRMLHDLTIYSLGIPMCRSDWNRVASSLRFRSLANSSLLLNSLDYSNSWMVDLESCASPPLLAFLSPLIRLHPPVSQSNERNQTDRSFIYSIQRTTPKGYYYKNVFELETTMLHPPNTPLSPFLLQTTTPKSLFNKQP